MAEVALFFFPLFFENRTDGGENNHPKKIAVKKNMKK
jgi:hypothetical protein